MYRGFFTFGTPKVHNHQCLEAGLPGTIATDFTQPRRGTYFYYLVTPTANGQEGTFGDGFFCPVCEVGVARPASEFGCPDPLRDRDRDNVEDALDNCPPQPDCMCPSVNPRGPGGVQSDVDFDAHGDICDNCVDVFNIDQGNLDVDLESVCDNEVDQSLPFEGGDECDADQDGDLIAEDGDASGTAGDNPCADGQTVDCDDNCPRTRNPGQEETDGDGIGDACDAT